MSVVARWSFSGLLALEAMYLVGIMAVVVPFGMAMDGFDDGETSLAAYGVYLVLAVSVAVLALAVVVILKRWSERSDRAAVAGAVLGIAAALNGAGALTAVALARSGDTPFWLLAAGCAVATGYGCLRLRAEPGALSGR